MEKTGQMPSDPSVFLNLRYWGSDGEGDAPHVSPSLTSGEIDDYIKVLKAPTLMQWASAQKEP